MSARDRIAVRKLSLYGYHGAHPEEAALGQRFELDIVVSADLASAGLADDLARTVDYGRLVAVATKAFGERKMLIEAAAEAVAAATLAAFVPVKSVEVTVGKPAAPIDAIFDRVEVTIRRDRT